MLNKNKKPEKLDTLNDDDMCDNILSLGFD